MANKLKNTGQGLVEFAILLPALLLLIMGALELGRMFQMYIVVTNAAREGAYYLSYVNTEDSRSCSGGVCFQGTISAAQNEGLNSGVTILPADVTITGCTSGAPRCTVGSTIAVTVTQRVNPAIIYFFTGPLPIRHTVRMVVQV